MRFARAWRRIKGQCFCGIRPCVPRFSFPIIQRETAPGVQPTILAVARTPPNWATTVLAGCALLLDIL
jgi:hypothetical protein